MPQLSQRAAAKRAEQLSGGGTFGGATWQKIENGAYVGPDDRIVLMALVVGVTPEELAQAGRSEAARLLRTEIARRAEAEPLLRDLDRATTSEAVMQLLLQGLEEIRQEERLSPQQKEELERQLIESQLAHLRGQLAQIRTMLRISGETG